MKQVAIALALVVYMNTACKKEAYPPDTPDCIRNTIEANKADNNWNIGRVQEYEYEGQLVYAFEPDNTIVDGSTRIVSSECEGICYLGGIAGVRMCNGKDFYQVAVLKRTIWTK